MGKWKHRLTNKDAEAMTGECVECGPVRLRWKAAGMGRPRILACGNRRRQDVTEWYKRKGFEHPLDAIVKPHGLTVGEARELRNGKYCAICGSAEKLHVDHDHATGKIRDVLCGNCNRGLGLFRDSPDLLTRAAQYLTTHQTS